MSGDLKDVAFDFVEKDPISNKQKLARWFGVALVVVDRWASGIAASL